MSTSSFPDRGTPPSQIVSRWQHGQFSLIVSEHIVSGAEGVWNRPYFLAQLGLDEPRRALSILRDHAKFIVPADDVRGVADDEEDDLVLATAAARNADYLVTGDKGLLAVGEYRGVAIVTPRMFLDLLLRDDTDIVE